MKGKQEGREWKGKERKGKGRKEEEGTHSVSSLFFPSFDCTTP
jgi:hypothetical protein